MIKRDSYNIYFEHEESTYVFRWTGSSPDFSPLADEALAFFQELWESNKDRLDVILDQEPLENFVPNWQGFGGTLLQSIFYENYKANPDFQTLISFLTVFAGSGDNTALYPAFGFAWNTFIISIGAIQAEEILLINTASNAFNIPFTIDDLSMIVFRSM